MSSAARIVTVVCVLTVGVGALPAQDWPQWRGPNRDNKVSGFSLPATWPKELSKKWQVKVGVGEASPLLVGDKVYVFARDGEDEVTLCLDAASGKEVWRDKHPAVKITGPASGYPGPRSTPAVGSGKVCTLGVHGVVSCLDAANGKVMWRKDTGAKPKYFTSTSPIIVDGLCIAFAGGLTAFDLGSGDPKWQWSGAEAPYGSPVLATIDGVKQIISPASGVLVGVGLADGKLLWQVKTGSGEYQSTYSTPLVDGAMVYYSVAAGKGSKGGKAEKGGSNMFAVKIEKKADAFTANEIWKTGLAAHGYHTPVLTDSRIYGVSLAGRSFFCVDAKTGDEIWKDKAQRGQCGSILDAGPVLIALTSDQQLVVFKSGVKEYTEVTSYKVGDAETWCVPIVAGKRIYVKDKGGALTLLTLD